MTERPIQTLDFNLMRIQTECLELRRILRRRAVVLVEYYLTKAEEERGIRITQLHVSRLLKLSNGC